MPEQIAYRVRRSTRARRIRIKVDPDATVEVVIPQRARLRDADAAVHELAPWIHRRLAEVAAQRAARPPRDGWLPYLDERLTLLPQSNRTRVHRRGEQLLVPADPALARPALERWYRRVAREEIAARLDRASATANLPYTRLTIRAQRTRWASCSANGAMSFNWRLLLAPEQILEYVVWHEICHLQVPNHSRQFWALVATYCPDYRACAQWLREHGSELVLE